jgi:hypothetical protein
MDNFPTLSHLFVHNECDIARSGWFDEVDEVDEKSRYLEGWASSDGRFIRFRNGVPYRDKDRTIATLLAALHYATGQDSFNRFFSYADETRHNSLVPYSHAGFSAWIERGEGGEAIALKA